MKRSRRGLAGEKRRREAREPGSLAAVQALFGDALRHHQGGRLAEAERLYRQILALDPRHADSLHLLGVIAFQGGRHENAIDLIGQAIGLEQDVAFYPNNLGLVLEDKGRLDDAIEHYERALALKPDFAEAHYNLGNALKHRGRLDDAIEHYARALALKPDFAEAHNNLGNALKDQGRLDDAIEHYERALALEPDFAEAHNNLGEARNDRGRLDDAIEHYERALALKPDYAEAHNNLGNALGDQGRLGDAIEHFERALALKPDFAAAHNNLGNALRDRGMLDDAIERYERALALKPDFAEAHSNLLLCMNYHSALAADRLEAESRRWNEHHALQHRPIGHGHVNDREPQRRLRIGYVSPDFRRHSVSYFLEPLLRAHDHAAVEVFCYAEVRAPDAVTDRLKAFADHWRVTVGMSDDALAQRIRDDKIDILVDLAGHTASNRLLVFARKPAPVQLTWLGYPHTTGLSTIDYRLVDDITDPPDDATSRSGERLVRLEGGFLCYGPPAEAPGPVAPPSLSTGIVTFGSLNKLAKVSPPCLDAWAALLRRLPSARLLLKSKCLADGATRALLYARLAERGVAPERVTLLSSVPKTADHLAVYHRIDIALDSFPYNGTTTTCEALWMGVPVVTLRGERHAGRVGSSLLGRLDLHGLIAHSVEEYIEIAATLAADRGRLATLRQNLRTRMAASPLNDAPAFARKIEAAFRTMWRRWCEKDANH